MIEFCYETDFRLEYEEAIVIWIKNVVEGEGSSVEQLVYIFCDDESLLGLNLKYLNHDTYTDILTFPYGDAKALQADIFISVPRVRENAKSFGIDFSSELRRVMVHGVLHLLGYEDHNEDDRERMRELEDLKMKMFHVEQ
jgi:rRNA maturation RNase YbeY